MRKDAATGAILTSYDSMDAFGNVTEQNFANGVETLRSFDPKSGRLVSIDSTLSGGATVQDNGYQWRSNGILESRIQSLGGTTRQEVFGYDGLNRLEKSETFVNSVLARTLDLDFDQRGNLAYKISSITADTDVTAYTPVSGKNRLASATIGGVGYSFDYDAHGAVVRYDRLSSGDDKFIDWNARGLPERITVGASAADATPTARDEFEYGPDGQRFYKKSTWQDGSTQRVEHTFYVGSFEELVTDVQDTVLNAVQKSRIGDSIVHIRTFPDVGSPVSRIEYLHRDHLGSVEAVTDDFGALVRNLAYDPYGGRRSSDWLGELDSASTETLADDLRESTTRGYTGHEQLDRTGFVHMNGRVYDPVLGRFISPDPIVQNPTYSQSWNRYSYVMNSPISFNDPTGHVRQGSICSGGLIMCMNGDGSGVGGSNASFSVPRTTQTIRTSGSTYGTWTPTGREFVVTGWAYVFVNNDQRLVPQGEYRDTGFYQTRYSGGASTSIETSSVKVNYNEGSETDESINSHRDEGLIGNNAEPDRIDCENDPTCANDSRAVFAASAAAVEAERLAEFLSRPGVRRLVGMVGSAVTAGQIALDTDKVLDGTMSPERYGYRLSGNGVALLVGLSNPYAGLAAGVLVGSGELVYEKVLVPAGQGISEVVNDIAGGAARDPQRFHDRVSVTPHLDIDGL